MNENYDIDEKMGKKARDKVTGFTGIVVGKLEHLFGCTQYIITGEVGEDGKAKDNQVVIDEGRVAIVGDGIRPKDVEASDGRTGVSEVPESIGKVI